MDYISLTDEQLATLSQGKDSEAMHVLINRYKNLVSSIARSYFLNGGDVEDLIQEGMIGVFKAIETFNGNVAFKYYAYKCIKNSILSVIRRYNSAKNLPLENYLSLSVYFDGEIDKADFVADDNFGPEQSLINKESEVELKNKINNALTCDERKILSLYLQGYSYKNISEQIDKSAKFVDNNLQKIKKKLISALEV
ncbi:MAG: sigma-70 family RNA polymerase sigma factor [Clostridia bacterium]|nr:sigma-70 family RNA polymerase sigma factor [Clostridia bacterium]